MSALDIRSLARFSADLRRLPKVVAQRVATEAAPALTAAARRTVDAGQTAYGVPWQPGADGQKVTLRRTGAMLARLVYVAIGTKLRVALGVPYAKYQIGRRPVFPSQGGTLPEDYQRTLARVAVRVAREELER